MKLCFFAGEFGIVYRARLKRSSHEVAVKTLKGLKSNTCVSNTCVFIFALRLCAFIYIGEFNQAEVNTFVEESLKMSCFKHAHVMGLIGVCLDFGAAPLIIMPYMAYGSLLKYLKRERESLIVSEENDEDEVNCNFGQVFTYIDLFRPSLL